MPCFGVIDLGDDACSDCCSTDRSWFLMV